MKKVMIDMGAGLLAPLLLGMVALFSQGVSASGSATNLAVGEILVDYVGRGVVRFNGPLTGTPPACSTHGEHFAFDANTAGGRAVLSLVLAAQASGKTIRAYGKGTCDIHPNIESWSWGAIR